MRKRRVRTAKAPYDDNDAPDPDDQHLETLVGALQDNDRSLGELRREFNLQPELVLRLMSRHAGMLEEDPINEKIKLKSGIFTTLERVRAQKPSSACVQPSASVQLEADRDRLLRLLSDSPRHSSWLSEFHNLPVERIREIDAKWPSYGILVVSADLGQNHQFVVSLARPLEVALPEQPVTKPAPSSPKDKLAMLSDLDPQDVARMMWRPGKPQMLSGRRANSQNMMYRRRTPLVQL